LFDGALTMVLCVDTFLTERVITIALPVVLFFLLDPALTTELCS
jgi:hypothetical protein